MALDSTTLTELSQLGLTTEQMAAVLRLLARAVQPLEARREHERERQSRHRHVTSNVTVTPLGEKEGDNLSQEVKTNNPPQSPPNVSVTLPPAGFDAFWQAYPDRQGPRDKKAAIKAFRAAIKRDSLETILAGANAYRREIQATGKINTEFVKQARTWLNADGWKEEYANKPNGSITGRSRHDPQPGETRQQWLNRTRST